MVKLSDIQHRLNLESCRLSEVEITSITEDSRKVTPGSLFVAIGGSVVNGRDFIQQAIDNGAAAVMLAGPDVPDLTVPCLLAFEENLRAQMAQAAAIVYGNPQESLEIIGITGTNGKTTTAYLLESILAQLAPGVLGTISFRWPGHQEAASNTTPEGALLFASLAKMKEAGSKAAIMEVSSHALSLGRVSGLKFDRALFTNLTPEHLDFHSDLEDYYQAKKRLFTEHLKEGAKRAIINIDNEYGRRLASELGAETALTFGFSKEAEVRGFDLKLSRTGLALKISAFGQTWEQNSPLVAEFNAENILGAVALALSMGLSPQEIEKTLTSAKGAPGRLESVEGLAPGYLALVDYAHTPDALTKALCAARDLEPKRLLVVFGCGGDRDNSKRYPMGKAAGESADLVIVTSDNPRTEEPWGIIMEIEKALADLGLPKFAPGELVSDWQVGRAYVSMVDRKAAILEAMRLMEPGDLLLVAGKGHEDYQIIGREKRPFDDRREVYLAAKKEGKAI